MITETMSFAEFLDRGALRNHCKDYLKDKRRRKASCFTPQTVIYMQVLDSRHGLAPPIKCQLEGRRHSYMIGKTVLVFLEFESDAIRVALTHND